MMRLTLLLPTLFTASACLAPFELEAEVPNACVSKDGIGFGNLAPAQTTLSAVAIPSGPVILRQRLELPVGELASLEQVGETSLVLNSLSLLATAGSFSSIDSIEVAVVDPSHPDSGGVTLLRHELTGESTEVYLTPEERIDLVPLTSEGKLGIEVAVTAAAWSEPLVFDLTACFAVASRR
jgi:hypothetical protein